MRTVKCKTLDSMKNISKYVSVALLLFGAACSKSQEGSFYTPNQDDAKEIHFIQSSIEKEFAQGSRTGTIYVEIARTGDKGAYRVSLAQKGTNQNLFTIPAEVTIPDGKHSVSVPVEVNLADGTAGSSFKTTLYISGREIGTGGNGAQISQYSDKMTLTASFELEWETLYRVTGTGERIPQLATYHYNGYYTGRDSGLEVEKAVGANIFRVKNWASGVAFKFILRDDNTCTVPAQSIGFFNTNYNEYVYVSDMAVYLDNESAYGQYPCTYDKETNTFSFYLIYYVTGGYFSQGTERLVFDTDIDTTPVVEIAFEGIETTGTGFQAPKLSFKPNTYAKSYKATVVAGDIAADAYLRNQVREELIADKLTAVTPVRTFYEADASVWNVPKGNYTAVALAYDSVSNPGKLYTERFTNDPQGEYAVQVHDFQFYAPVNNPNYSPYNTLVWQMKTSRVKTAKYLCMRTDFVDYMTEELDQTLEELTASEGHALNDEAIAILNSEDGIASTFSPLDQGSEFVIALLLTNEFGDSKFVSTSASTSGYFAKDFDRTKTMQDFLGAFSTTATVKAGSNSSQNTYRTDITRLNDRDVLIEGTTGMRDFAPQLKGYYDSEKHMIVVETQYAGPYKGNYATLGFSDGLMIYWGGESMAIGYIGDTLHWTANPDSGHKVTNYMFLLFSTPQAVSANYLREYVGSKQYSAITMKPLKLAPAQAAAPKSAELRTHGIEVGGRTVDTYLMGDTFRPVGTSVRTAAPAPAARSEQKSLRSGLTLRAHIR